MNDRHGLRAWKRRARMLCVQCRHGSYGLLVPRFHLSLAALSRSHFADWAALCNAIAKVDIESKGLRARDSKARTSTRNKRRRRVYRQHPCPGRQTERSEHASISHGDLPACSRVWRPRAAMCRLAHHPPTTPIRTQPQCRTID